MKVNVVYLFVILVLISYLAGYYLYAADRSIFSWVYLIHYLSLQALVFYAFVSFVLAAFLSRFELPEGYFLPVVAGLALLLALPLFGLPQFNYDSAVYYSAARYIQEKGVFDGMSTLPEAGYDALPGYPLILSFVYRLSEGYLATQLLHGLIFILLPVLVYLIGREVWDSRTGLFAALFSMSTPIILDNHYFLLPDVPLTVFTLACVYTALKAFKNHVWLILFFPLLAMTSIIKVTGLLFVFSAVAPLVLFRSWSKADLKKLLKTIGGIAILGVLVLAVVSLTVPSLAGRIHGKLDFINPISNILRFFTIGDYDPSMGLPFQVGFPQAILFAVFVFFSLKNRDRRDLLVYFWILLPFAVAHDTKVRYLLPLFPAVSLGAALALQKVADSNQGKTAAYFACAMMAIVTLAAVPHVASSYAVRNLQVQAEKTDGLEVKTIGVFAYDIPIPQYYYAPGAIASLVDYYSVKDVVFLGSNWERNTSRYTVPETRLMDSVYPSVGYTPGQMKKLLDENYTSLSSSTGGKLRSFDTYYADLYQKKPGKSGPTDAILYLSNIDTSSPESSNLDIFCNNYAYSFFCRDYLKSQDVWAVDQFTQVYHFGPLQLTGAYGTSVDSWLGENMLGMKPPNVGQVNSTYSLLVPENTTLKFSVSLRPDTWHPLKGDGVEFRVLVDDKVVYDRYIDPKNNPSERRLFEEEVDMRPYWGRNVNFVLQTMSGPKNNSMYDTVGWGNPRLVYI